MNIQVREIERTFTSHGGLLGTRQVRALRGVTMEIQAGAVISIVGESGCGKTTFGRILSGLERFDRGSLWFDGQSLTEVPPRDRTRLFRKVQLIQQDPFASLNPMRTLRQALLGPLTLRARELGESPAWVAERAVSLLGLVGLDPRETLHKYPHSLSGGQRQRFVIARALAVEPEVLVADEAVSMIDVSLRLGILRLFGDLNRRLGLTIIFITHDIAAARYISRQGDLCVLYRGKVAEFGRCDTVIHEPLHPYTQALLSAMPVIRGLEAPGPDRLIPDTELSETGGDDAGCVFAPRCPHVADRCRAGAPALSAGAAPDHLHACFFPVARRVAAQPLPSKSV